MATHSSTLAWKIPRMENPGGLPSMGVTRSQTQLKWLSNSSSKFHWTRLRSVQAKTDGAWSNCIRHRHEVTQSCPTLCDPVDSRQPGSYVHGILQARILKWVAIPFSNAWKLKVKMKPLSHARLLVTPWTAVYQAPPMGFSRQEYWSGVPLSSPWSKAGIPNLSMKLKYWPKQLWKHFSPLEQNTFVSLKYNLMKISLFKIDKRSISDQKDSKD